MKARYVGDLSAFLWLLYVDLKLLGIVPWSWWYVTLPYLSAVMLYAVYFVSKGGRQ